MTDGKTTHAFSMNTVHPLDRDFDLMTRSHYPYIPLGHLPMLRHYYPFIPFGRLVMKRHHYPPIPCAPCSGKSKFDLVYIPIVYFDCKYFTSLYFIYARPIRTPPRDFANPCRGIKPNSCLYRKCRFLSFIWEFNSNVNGCLHL